jgi:hypothetical protein
VCFLFVEYSSNLLSSSHMLGSSSITLLWIDFTIRHRKSRNK